MAKSAITSISLYSLSIPMKRIVSHAAGRRATADPLVVVVRLLGNVVGYGETLPRTYVTGETTESCMLAIQDQLSPPLLDWRPDSFPAALEAIDALPYSDAKGHPIMAARAGLELALIDAYSKLFQRPVSEAAGWLGLGRLGPPGCIERVRCTGVLAGDSLESTRRSLRLLRWYGIRHFKLKVGMSDDDAKIALVARKLGRGLRSGRLSLRLDANSGWTADQAIHRLRGWSDVPLSFIEQPLAAGDMEGLARLRSASSVPILHDESLITKADAEALVSAGVAGGFNIRISKCGGWLPSLQLAHFALRHKVKIVLGCMVGETSILSAVARRLLESVPTVEHVEGNFGRFLLRRDIATPSLRFGYGGRLKPLGGWGWGVQVDDAEVSALCQEGVTLQF